MKEFSMANIFLFSKVICKLLLDIFRNQVSKSSWLGSYASCCFIRKVVFTLYWWVLIHFTPIFSKLQEMDCQLDVAVLYNDCWSFFLCFNSSKWRWVTFQKLANWWLRCWDSDEVLILYKRLTSAFYSKSSAYSDM